MKDALTKQELIIMEILWNRHPMFLSEIMEEMSTAVNWQKSTYSTSMKKLCDNGYIGYKTVSGNRAYFPMVQRQDCMENESRYMMSKLPQSSAKMFLTCMIRESGLSEADKLELQELITNLKNEQEGKKPSED